MLELRYDPIKDHVVAIATQRQERTFLPPRDFCPLCPTKPNKMPTEIPASEYDIVVFENRFPTFSRNPDMLGTDLFSEQDVFRKGSAGTGYVRKESKGICEVVCYTSDHDLFLEKMPEARIRNLVKVWMDRYAELGSKKYIKYVLIFENKGEEIGVTLSHPHGQIYAFSFIPPVAKTELSSSKKFYDRNNGCLHCQVVSREVEEGKRVIDRDDNFISFIPFYARWPYEVHIYPLRHMGNICRLENGEIGSLAKMIKKLLNRYNRLFNFRMPYTMVIHQVPADNKKYPYYHFHLEFYPPYRTRDKLKYLAGCELGAGTFINDTLPEEKAAELRDAR
ncbi:MAG: galactose-1-phosphate uridylyltransferase [Actinomycetota bacterium]